MIRGWLAADQPRDRRDVELVDHARVEQVAEQVRTALGEQVREAEAGQGALELDQVDPVLAEHVDVVVAEERPRLGEVLRAGTGRHPDRTGRRAAQLVGHLDRCG